ncbi:MAG: hypothetical protein PHW03_07695 [Eubacteriales bacterium]|nr:hypothetical protein [Eubacteriales bacterium]MDD4390654.1 hypothetical protein [Eubacteriales bacterium]
MNLPHGVRGYTILNSDGSYSIMINARMSAEMQMETYRHEIAHIDSKDFDLCSEVDSLEYEKHVI